jgi:hypothetical protein
VKYGKSTSKAKNKSNIDENQIANTKDVFLMNGFGISLIL